jgi:hypothetical protein
MGWLVIATMLSPVAVAADVSVEITSIGVAGSVKSWAGSGTETDPYVVEYTKDDADALGTHLLLDIERVVDDPKGSY